MRWRARHHQWDLSHRTLVMGILNVTPDSFSDGGRYDQVEAALAHARTMLAEGADILDIGGESTRPGAGEVSAEEERARVLPVIEAIMAEMPDTVISIDTSKAAVAEAAINAGAAIINDVTGLLGDSQMARLAARTEAGLVLMHMRGRPRTMQQAPRYEDVVREVRDFLECQGKQALAAGVAQECLVFDPGIGFGKTVEHNLRLLKHLEEFRVWNCPVLLGVSRKSFMGAVLDAPELEARKWPTVALTAYAIELGVRLIRVHDVRPNVHAARMIEAIISQGAGASAD